MIDEKKLPRVQFVSKPICAPFSDGSKCLVRDLALHLTQVQPHLLSIDDDVPEVGPRAVVHSIYGSSGSFRPALRQNIQVALWMLLRCRADIWHFVFAPNPRSSQVARILRSVRGVPVVQTVASPPLSFSNPQSLLFGDVAVTQSEWTRQQFLRSYDEEGRVPPLIAVIPPPAPWVNVPTDDEVSRVRKRLAIKREQPLFVYPGDLEVSHGAANIVEWARAIAERLPDARIVIAYRDKTDRAQAHADALAMRVDPKVVVFERNVSDIHALVAAATAVLFPVDDLYGKVDIPIVLLEALRLETPVLALDAGPLAGLEGAQLLPNEGRDWVSMCLRVFQDLQFRRELIASGTRAVLTHYAPKTIAEKYERLYAEL